MTTKNRENNIELELRAEVSSSQYEKLLTGLREEKRMLSHTKRLSAMFLGEINRSSFDLRVRIGSDGKIELVAKKGDFHAHDRVEKSLEISKSQFIGIVKILSLFNFQSKITERDNFVFNLGDDITMTLVKAGAIAYVEIEKMSNEKNLEENKAELLDIIDDFKLKRIKDGKEFNKLCERLTKCSDWAFDGSNDHIDRLKDILESY